jgi:hypothetical protein
MPDVIIQPYRAPKMQAVQRMNSVARTDPRHHHAAPSTNMITGIQMLGAGIVTITAAGLAQEIDTRWSILTLAGAIMVSAMAWMLNENAESRKVVFGRAIGAILIGVCGSRLFWHFSDWAQSKLQDPLLMVLAGAAFGFVGYMLAAALVGWWKRRADSIVDRGMKWGDRYLPPEEDSPNDVRHAGSDPPTRRKRR